MHHLMRILALWLTVGMLCGPAQADQLNDRFNAIKGLAEQGQTNAMYQLGQMYELGMGTAPDTGKAYTWYQKAAKKGQPDAAYQIGYAYYWGKAGRPKDRTLAFQWFMKAAEQGNRTAMTYLSKMYALGQGTPRDKEEAEVWADRAHVAQRQPALVALPPPAAKQPAREKPQPAPKTAPAPVQPANAKPAAQAITADSVAKPPAAATLRPSRHAAAKPAAKKDNGKPGVKKPTRKAPVAKAKPAPRPSTPDRVMAGIWHKGKRPAVFLPSENTHCKKVADVLRCTSALIVDHQYDTPFRYRFISTLSDFKRKGKGSFKVDYKAQLIDILDNESVGYSASDGDTEEEASPVVTAESITEMLSRRHDQLTCAFSAKDSIECVNGRGKKQRFSRI